MYQVHTRMEPSNAIKRTPPYGPTWDGMGWVRGMNSRVRESAAEKAARTYSIQDDRERERGRERNRERDNERKMREKERGIKKNRRERERGMKKER